MEYITGIIDQIIANFDWAYMVSVNVLTYGIIKFIDYCNGTKPVSTIIKKIVLILAVIGLAVIYKFVSDIDNRILLNSAILAPVAWDYIIRPIIKKIGIGYRIEEESTNNSL